MKRWLGLGATMAAVCAFGAVATNDWENLAVNSANRLPARTYAMPLADERAALTPALEPETPYRKSLNGTWKLSWAGNPALRVRGFERPEFDDSDWFGIDVPSCLEMRGFGSPGYTNTRYPHANKWPLVLDRDTNKPDYNPVGSYRTSFTTPASWKGRRTVLRFDGVASAYYVWVNGRKVGYAEDSKLPSEFDVTAFLNADGRPNVLAVEVYKWCDGSYLEDQDMFRYSGIYRDVTLWAMPPDGIEDFKVKTAFRNGYADATLTVETDATAGTLYDADFREVGKLARAADGALELAVDGVKAWSAEKPYLYTLVLKKGTDVRAKRVGFKEVKVQGNAVLVNGRKIKFKGVNRHETNPENGRTVSMKDMLADVTLFKRHNFNTVRTSHYPDHHSWYDLCDRYGVYVIAEANVEGHEPGYRANGLGRFPAWEHSIVERNLRHVAFYRNHPSVTFWSMGNETGHGPCFQKAIAEVKKLDPSRPVHWERGNADADVDSCMYPSVEWLVNRGKLGDEKPGGKELKSAADGDGFAISGHTAGKPFIMCEYAHAMGNAVGNFREYWDAIYSYDALLGGCIWDWVDQAVWKYTDRVDPKTGERERFLAYGGDWDEQPNDGPFCCNGVVDPFRRVSAKLVEVGHVQRNLIVRTADAATGEAELENRFGFTDANEFAGAWELVEDGVKVDGGAFAVPSVKPLSRGRLALPKPTVKLVRGKEYFYNVSFATVRDEAWARKGWIVARDQLPFVAKDAAAPAPCAVKALGACKPLPIEVKEDARAVTVGNNRFRATFCRKSGTLAEWTLCGTEILRDPAKGIPAGPRLTCQRAFTDNDRWVRQGATWSVNRAKSFVASGLTQLRYHARPLKIARGGCPAGKPDCPGTVRVTAAVEVTCTKSAGFTHVSEWTFRPCGKVTVKNVVTPFGVFPEALPRLGTSWKLAPALESMTYYGRGPRENYVDRNSGSFVGLWRSTVTDQYEPYVRPQDCGRKSDVRWVAFTDETGSGVKFSASEPLFVQALHYGVEDLQGARFERDEPRRYQPLVARPEVLLDLDVRQLGLGGASCGPIPMEKYRFRAEKTEWTLTAEPFVLPSTANSL